jgi:hypothetical protein
MNCLSPSLSWWADWQLVVPAKGHSVHVHATDAPCLASRGPADPADSSVSRREDFRVFPSMLLKRTDELLFSARALVARIKDELLARQEGSAAGLPVGINVH